MNQKYLRVTETADRYRVSRSTIYRWMDGDGVSDFPQPIKFGKATLFDIAQLEAWEQSQRAGEVAA